MAVALLGAAMPALAQARRIQGKVVDDNGAPVGEAAIEASIVSLSSADSAFAMRNNDQVWRTRTNAAGDYIVTVPGAGEYVVTATKDGVGSERTRVAVQRSGLVTANLTLWKSATAAVVRTSCGTGASIGAFKRSGLAAGADPRLARLLGWLEAVQLHTPGCADPPALEVGRWPIDDLATLLRDVRELVAFLRRAEDERSDYAGRAGVQRDQAILFIHDRRVTLDELERSFYGNQPLKANEMLRRGAVLHADIGIFVPGDLGRYPLVEDGGQKGWRGGSSHWEVGRQLLDSMHPSATRDAGVLLWYRAVSAHLFQTGNLAALPAHLARARYVFPESPYVLFDSACLHEQLSSPAIQASAQQLRANAVNVAVGSRTSELERAERYFREALSLAPDDIDGRVRHGHALGALGRHGDAAAEFRRAIDATPDKQRLYFAALFLGREEEAMGRRDEAKRRYQQAAELYPRAQSPRLALSRLAQQAGDRSTAQQALQALPDAADADRADPWWEFYHPHKDDARELMGRMRKIGTTQ